MHGERFTALCFRIAVSIFLHSPPSPPRIRVTEIPRRINSTNIFTSKGDDFDNLVLSLALFPPLHIIFCNHFHKFGYLN
jgi:hypothetical protein